MTLEYPDRRSWLSYIRHELGTPINAIIGYSGLLSDELQDLGDSIPGQLSLNLDIIKTEGEQILFLVKTILATSKLENDPENADLDSWFRELHLEGEKPITSIIRACEQVLPVIPEDFRPDILKIQKAVTNLLTMIDNLVHGQSLELNLVDSAKNKPFIKTQVEKSAQDKEISEQPKTIKKNKQTQTKLLEGNILIVDDRENNRDLLSRYTQEEGLTVATATNGVEAIGMIQTGDYDLILLDLIMPQMDGYQVLQWLHSSQWRYIPVIMISALDELDSVVKCIEMGAEDYLPKPFNPTLLRARITASLEKKRLRDQEKLYLDKLAKANREITILNSRLQEENLAMGAKLEITRQLQQMILPREKELSKIKALDIAGIMQPAEEVGGDYYDVLTYQDRVKFAIGDVTGHGLESSVLMLMAQTAVRTLIEADENNPKRFLEILNRTLYQNAKRMKSRRQLTLSLIDYKNGQLRITGQHEDIIVVRADGVLEIIDTADLGLPIGLTSSIAEFVNETEIFLNPGDVVVLYTDGITEAENNLKQQYGVERLCNIVRQNSQLSASEIKRKVIDDVFDYIGEQTIYDDITLVVFKQKPNHLYETTMSTSVINIEQTFGDFLDNLPNDEEYLIIHFSPSSVPLKEKWRNNGLSADFMADYLLTFLTVHEKQTQEENFTSTAEEIRDAVNFVANELLENAMKYNNQDTNYPIILELHLQNQQIVFCLTNSVISENLQGFQDYINDILTRDTQELLMEQIEKIQRKEHKKSGGLGYLTMINDYGAKLGWKFQQVQADPEIIIVKTMVQLPF
jgi:sigma-B regulation protein RsbU (phosphoserine phosphatase)